MRAGRLILIGVPLVAVLLAEIAQLVLPGLAEQRIRDRLAPGGRVLSVSVSAFPAVELLWGDADRIVVRMDSYRVPGGRLGPLLESAGAVGELDATAGVLRTGLLVLHDARLQGRGADLRGSAVVREADLRAAIPILQGVTPVASGGGSLTLQGTADVLGVRVRADAVVAVRAGTLVVTPDVPFGALASIRLFGDPRLVVASVGARSVAGGFAVTAVGHLRAG